MDFIVKADFAIEDFLAACRVAGVKLFRETDAESTDGHISFSAGALAIVLLTDTPEVRQIITEKVAQFNV